MKKLFFFIVMIAFYGMNEAICQWNTIDNNIYNTNSGNVGIGNSLPSTLLYVGKSMTEPTITVRNLGGTGGATYTMIDDASGANWKFKATLNGGFKIRDHASLMDVITIEPNSFANAIYIKTTDNMGIGTATPDNSALVEMSSTSKGFLPPRMTQAEIQDISNPANGLIVYCTTFEKYYAFTSGENAWKEILFGSGTIINPPPPYTCGTPIIVTHVTGPVAPVTKTVTYGTVTNIPGETSKCWITSNLGADHQATAANDATEASAGWYWQFNKMQGFKHDGTTLTPGWSITSISENSQWIIANDPCALLLENGWRLPTYTEWTNVDLTGGWGNPWNSDLKIHLAGFLSTTNGSLNARGSFGDYWSSTQHNLTNGWYLANPDLNYGVYNINKAYGNAVRCIKD